jgi:hypothetical protein
MGRVTQRPAPRISCPALGFDGGGRGGGGPREGRRWWRSVGVVRVIVVTSLIEVKVWRLERFLTVNYRSGQRATRGSAVRHGAGVGAQPQAIGRWWTGSKGVERRPVRKKPMKTCAGGGGVRRGRRGHTNRAGVQRHRAWSGAGEEEGVVRDPYFYCGYILA